MTDAAVLGAAEDFESEYLRFYEVQMKPSMTTRGWLVVSTSLNRLGIVKFYGAWRQYVFHPGEGTIFNKGCMEDLARFCDMQTDWWKIEVAERRRSRG